MEEKNVEKHQESKKFLVFYVIGLFCVALALILMSYVSQVRADRQLNELNSALTRQNSAVEGANARVQVLQQSVEEQAKLLEQQGKTLEELRRITGSADDAKLTESVLRMSKQKAILYELAIAEQELAQEKIPEAQARLTALVQTYQLEVLNGTSKDALLKEESAALFTDIYNRAQLA